MWYLRIQFYFYIVVSNYLKNVWYKKTWGIQTLFYNLSLKKIYVTFFDDKWQPGSIRRVGHFRFVIKTVTIYLRCGNKRFPGMNKSSCHPTDINGRKYILIIIFQSCYNTCFCTSFVENITSLVSQIESPTLLIDSGLKTRWGEPPMM